MNHLARPRAGLASSDLRLGTLSYQSLQFIAASLDICLLILASVLGFAIYQYYLTGELVSSNDGLGVGFLAGVLFIALSRSRGLYEIHAVLGLGRHFRNIWAILAVTLLLLANIMFLLKVGIEYSRGSIILFGALAFIFIGLGRASFAHFAAIGIQKGFIAGRRAVTIGEASELVRLAPSDLRRFGIEEMARIEVIRSNGSTGLSQGARARITGAMDVARQLHAAEFVLLVPWAQERLLAEIADLLRPSPLPVKLLPDLTVRNIVRLQPKGGPDPFLAVEVQRAPLSRWERSCKRAVDLVLSLSALVLLVPLLLITAVAIKLDSKGPILFRQRRCGFDSKEFVIYKFRTMTVLDDGENVVQVRPGDVRVTRIGRLLRRSSVDELPQLFNVLRGDMSLVGPRPHAMAHHDKYCVLIATYALRHHVKPGLTGMAQMNGLRGETSQLAQMERRVEQDLWYINHWSLMLDALIMARTCLVVLRQEVY